MDWYRVVKTIRGRRYHYWQKTYREGSKVKTLNKYIGPVESYATAGMAERTKIVDKDGKPLKVYHGTLAKFKTFDPSKVGQNTEWKNAHFGFFFSERRDSVDEFMETTRKPGDHRAVHVKEAYLDIRKPLDFTPAGIFNVKEQAPLIMKVISGDQDTELSEDEALEWLTENIDLGDWADFQEALYEDIENKRLYEEHGYDGIISQFGRDEEGRTIREFVAFRPDQIRIIGDA